MAKFEMQLPEEILRDFKKLYDNADEIFGAMTQAGAEAVMHNIKANAPASIKNSNMMKCLKLTKVYKTKQDGGINTKVAFYGYFENHNGQRTPAPLVANIFEYGRSAESKGGAIQKHPFIRKSFRKEDIEKAMLEAQKKASGGLLDE